MLRDARSIDEQTELAFDLIIIGAGPAGITIADRLRSANLSICWPIVSIFTGRVGSSTPI